MLKVVYSNDMLQLAATLAAQQQSAPLPPLEAETIIVQSNELSRWLSLYLAQHHSIASHIDFPYPSAYIWALFRRVLPDIPKESAFSKDAMTWRIFDLLPTCAGQSGFEAIAGYLGEQDDHDDVVKRFGLAHRIADSFDQYLMYRPDWVQSWEQAGANLPHWQAMLWQRLTANVDQPAMHRANLLERLKAYLQSCTDRPVGLPRRLAIFGVSALPPVYLELYELMGRHCDITLYFLSPSEGYWGDLVDPKRQGQQTLDFGEDAGVNESGHPLLASLGKQGQDFFEQIQQCEHESESLFSLPDSTSLLGQLQGDIVQLVDPSLTADKRLIADDDDSIQCHACHSTMREVEVLHDQLLTLFERHPDLSPTDVVVMTPDVDVYAGAIDAVFGTAPKGLFIPYGISGASGQQQSPVLSAFDRLLALPESRFDVESIVALLDCEAIQQRFALNEQAVMVIRLWCRETHIHWALSAEDKAALDLPATEANSWRAGLDRLLLGYALPLSDDDGGWRLFDGQLGVDGIRGERAQTMAQLCAFVDALDRARQRLKQSNTAQQWQQTLLGLLTQFFKPQHDNARDQADILSITQALASLVESTELATFEQTMLISLVREWLKGNNDVTPLAQRFMGHGVTFCGMVPMRSIPFAVVCLIGMNDDSFPRRQPKQGFDLLSYDFRKGDRSRRDDDRYLFLEAILSAQQHCYMSYVGASIVDNAPIPPSVLVSDVRDVLRQGFEQVSSDDIWSQVLTEHPLQSFSRRYFDGSSGKLVSYQSAQCPPNEQQAASNLKNSDWFNTALPEPDAEWRQVSLSQLIQFYRHPGRYLMQQRLGLRLELDEDVLESREPFSLGGLEAWQLRQQVLAQRLNGDTLAEITPLIEATGVLPQGVVGDIALDGQTGQVEEFVERVLPVYPEAFLAPIGFDLTLGEFSLLGQLEGVSSTGLFQYRLGKVKGGELLAVWCRHLILNCLRPKGVVCESRWITEDADIHLLPVAEPETLLLDLLNGYWTGCQEPLPLLANTSFAYAKAALNGGRGNPDNAMWATWLGGQFAIAESEDIYYQQLYNTAPLDDAFKVLALAIYQPIYDHLDGGRL
jgi:exodeoxyribonuclease V gamma subunit